MKELSIEQKARRYDEAKYIMNEYLESGNAGVIAENTIKKAFPELAGSEDERVRNEIVRFIQMEVEDEIVGNKWIAWLKKQESVGEIVERCKTSWYNEGKIQGQIEGLSDEEKYQQGWHDALEKQGEQKPADKTKPKFHEGQWIVWQDKCYKVNYNGCGYELVDQNGLSTSLEYGTVDENAHIWDITKDARVGDVLACDDKDKVFIYNGKLDLKGRVCAYCGIYKTYDELRFTECAIGNSFTYKKPHPATKEQRDTLMKAMVNAGYTFDFEKKEPKKIEQMSSWSEEDKNFMYDTLSNLTELKDRYGEGYGNVGKCIGWLKSLKPQNTWKPSDEQVKALEYFVRSIGESGYASPYENNTKLLYSLLNDLKKLKA